MRIISTLLIALTLIATTPAFVNAQDIPEHISYSHIYELIDELANDGIIMVNSTIKPYSRSFIAQKLIEAQQDQAKLSKRQRNELSFYLNEFALELNQLSNSQLSISKSEISILSVIPPAFSYKDSLFRAKIVPLLGLHVNYNQNAQNKKIIKRWYGADFQTMIGKHISVYGSLRDISVNGDTLTSYRYLNNNPGYEYKEAAYGGDYSESRGGIKYSTHYGSIGLVKDNPIWGDSYHCSNILSGRAPSFPMLTLNLKPVKWFELNYFHAWLISNIKDSTNYYLDNLNKKYYRQANKFMAANMFTFTPVQKLNISFGNSIIYGEPNVQPVYFIPIAFYKSMDHLLTKGIGTENQNSQLFFNISSRNIKHLHLYSSAFLDEVSVSRFLPSNKEQNPISVKLGAQVSNFPVKNLSFVSEYTRTNIITYKHSLPPLTYTSNSYYLGHYLGDNSSELYLAMKYKPIRGLNIQLSYVDAKKGNDFEYVRISSKLKNIISQPVLGEIIFSSKTISLNTQYEIFNNIYCLFDLSYSDVKANNSTSVIEYETEKFATDYLNRFSNPYMHGQNIIVTAGVNFGF